MDIRSIHNDTDYKAALKVIAHLVEQDPEVGTAEGDQLDILTTLVQAYEAQVFPIDLPEQRR